MGDLTHGETFAAGEVVTAGRMHSLVDNAQINPRAVGALEIALACITDEHFAPGLKLSNVSVALAPNHIFWGNDQSTAVGLPLSPTLVAVGDPLSLGIAPLGIKTSHLDIGVLSADTTGRNKMADGFLEYRHFPSVTGSRLLGNAAATGPVQEIGLGNGLGFVGGKLALTGGAGGALVPVIYDIQDGGSGDIPVPNEGAEIHHSHGLGRAPITAQVFLYPIIDDAGYRANAQPGIPDYVTAESFTTGIPNGDAVQAFSVWTSFDTIALCRPNVGTDPELTVPHRTGFGRVAITQSSWRVRLVIT